MPTRYKNQTADHSNCAKKDYIFFLLHLINHNIYLLSESVDMDRRLAQSNGVPLTQKNLYSTPKIPHLFDIELFAQMFIGIDYKLG